MRDSIKAKRFVFFNIQTKKKVLLSHCEWFILLTNSYVYTIIVDSSSTVYILYLLRKSIRFLVYHFSFE